MKKVRWNERKKILNRITELRQQGLSSPEIATQLNSEGTKTKKGHDWKSGAIDSYVYVCRKAGMRLVAKAPSQLHLKSEPVEQTKPIEPVFSTQPQVNNDALNAIAQVIQLKINNGTRLKLIRTLLNE